MVVGMNQPPEDWQRLADHVRAARRDAGFATRRALANATGITERTLGKLERGERVSPDTLDAVAKAVGWAPGIPRRVLAGGDLGGTPAEESPRPPLEAVPGPLSLPDDPSDEEVVDFILDQESPYLRRILMTTWRAESILRGVRVASVRAVAAAEAEASRPAEGRERRREPGA